MTHFTRSTVEHLSSFLEDLVPNRPTVDGVDVPYY
jgi:hypothetical protein